MLAWDSEFGDMFYWTIGLFFGLRKKGVKCKNSKD